MLRKWNSSELAVLAEIPHELVDSQSNQSLDINHCTNMLGMERNTTSDTFRPVVSSLKQVETLTKRALLSDIYSKIVQRIALVLSSDCQAEDSPPARMEGKV